MIFPFYFKSVFLFLVLKLCNCWTDAYQANKNGQSLEQFVNEFAKRQEKEPVQTIKFNKPIFSYVGCFADRREARDIFDKEYTYITKFNKTLPTVELCVNLCAQDGFSVAGVQAL